MELINYTPSFPQELPEGVVRYNKKKHKGPKDIYAHAHFVKGIQVYDFNCEYCKGIKKPKKTTAEIAEKKRMKYKYYLEWKNKSPFEDEINQQNQHIKDLSTI